MTWFVFKTYLDLCVAFSEEEIQIETFYFSFDTSLRIPNVASATMDTSADTSGANIALIKMRKAATIAMMRSGFEFI
jgi:hypothetical protein